MRRALLLLSLVALAVAVMAAPAVAQKSDVRSSDEDPVAIPSGGIDYNISVDDTGQTYEFIDATGGTLVPIGDDEYVAVVWPFDFSVYNDTYLGGVDSFEINSNGSIHFDIGGPRTAWLNCGDPPSTIDGQWVAALGDDLNPASAGEVWWDVSGSPGSQILTVAWLRVPEFGDTGSVDIQVNFHEGSNMIVTQYEEIVAPNFLGDGIVGINAGDGVVGVEVACASAGNMPRPSHDVEYIPKCVLTASVNDNRTLRAGDALWVDFEVIHARPGTLSANALVEVRDLADDRVVARRAFRGLVFDQFERTNFGGTLSRGLPTGRYELSITLNGMSGWNQRSRELIIIE